MLEFASAGISFVGVIFAFIVTFNVISPRIFSRLGVITRGTIWSLLSLLAGVAIVAHLPPGYWPGWILAMVLAAAAACLLQGFGGIAVVLKALALAAEAPAPMTFHGVIEGDDGTTIFVDGSISDGRCR